MKNKKVHKINPKDDFFLLSHNIDKPLVRWTKKKRKTQLTNIWNERWDLMTDCNALKHNKEILQTPLCS